MSSAVNQFTLSQTATNDQVNSRLHTVWNALRITFFLVPFLSGLDKFFYVLGNWEQYLSPLAQHVLGGMSHPFMLLSGVIEMTVGVMIITKWTRLGAYIASVWLLLIATNLIAAQYYDIALRDIGLSLCAFALAKLTETLSDKLCLN